MQTKILIFFLSLLQICKNQSNNCNLTNCYNCLNESICTTCITGFIKSQNGTICSPIDTCSQSACVRCINNICSMCIIGYSLQSSGECIKCPVNCVLCTENGTCLLCVDFIALQNGVCGWYSIEGCLIVYNPYVCLSCSIEYYNINGICQSCIKNCHFCTNSSNCFLCQNGYFLQISNSIATCKTCYLPCQNCLVNGHNCTLCNLDSYLFNNTCIFCYITLPFCITCTLPVNSSKPFCSSCLDGMFVSTNGNCLKCPNGCLTCTNQIICQSCNIMFFLNSNNSCQPCGIPNCVNCSNNQTCLVCVHNFILSQINNFCLPCPLNCHYCTIINQSVICSKCDESYFLDQITNTCRQCMQNCQQCTSEFDCESCFYNFYRIIQNGLIKCQACPIYCGHCKIANQKINCFYCPPGQFSIKLLYQCQTCPNNCFNCNNTYNTCSLCNSGFYLTQQGLCNQCQQGCGICSNFNNCQICMYGYFYQNQQCFACFYGCINCNSTTCFQCAQGFFLSSQSQSDFQCQNCPNGCLKCMAENICILCLDNYYLLTSSPFKPQLSLCSPCIHPCSICENNSTCLVCQRGYTLNSSGQCTQYPGNFAVYERSIGFKCLDRFVLVFNGDKKSNITQKCLPCEKGCQKCKYFYTNKSLICLSCSLTYTLTNTGQCFQCGYTNQTKGCLSCSSQNNCNICLNGFTLLTNGTCINLNFYTNSNWPLIIANICLTCFFIILIILVFVQRSFIKIKSTSTKIELTNKK